jgi:hypothetical protein
MIPSGEVPFNQSTRVGKRFIDLDTEKGEWFPSFCRSLCLDGTGFAMVQGWWNRIAGKGVRSDGITRKGSILFTVTYFRDTIPHGMLSI